jgi:hypothetical protein
MEPESAEPTQGFARQSREFDEAALDFARLCLLQPESTIDEYREITVKPDGYCSGPEGYTDNQMLQYDDIHQVLSLVAYWCKLNSIKLEIHYFDEVYSCSFIEGDPINQIIETNGSANLCHELLFGASFLAKHMKSVNPPNTSMTWANFIEGRKEDG